MPASGFQFGNFVHARLSTFVVSADGAFLSVTVEELSPSAPAPAGTLSCLGGYIVYRSGAEFHWGIEARSEYQESLAPANAADGWMGNTLTP